MPWAGSMSVGACSSLFTVLVLSGSVVGWSNVTCESLSVKSVFHTVCLVLAMCCNENLKSMSIPVFTFVDLLLLLTN